VAVEMADSKDNSDNASSDDEFGDDLDEMLKNAESASDDQDDLIDDEDAIDRLLVDDTDYSEAQESANDIDEFAEDEPVDSGIENTISEDAELVDEIEEAETEDEFDVDDLINPEAVTSNTEEDEFAAQESTSSVEDKIESEDLVGEDIGQSSADEAGDDFLMADFDISSEDKEFADSADEQAVDFGEESEPHSEVEQTDEKAIETSAVIPQVVVESAADNAAIEAINTQVTQLLAENESFKLQIVELVALTKQGDSNVEEIELLQKEQRKFKKAIKESESKVPVVVYIALGIAILALLIGGGLGAIGYGAQSSVMELSELVMTLEEEIETVAAKDSSADIKKLDDRTRQLLTKGDQINKQLEEMSSSLQSNPLKPVVNDLVVQNNHAQEAIEQLLAKVETLEKSKPVEAKLKKPKKVAIKVTWVVNLVSFKQEWYAKRKSSEFQKKGVPAEVVQVKVKGENWFRLRVKGFKSKYDAAAYAVKVKKTLNLSSVWVTKA
jgi:hypothetical protein